MGATSTSGQVLGTLAYTSPEGLGLGMSRVWECKSDIWSLGIMAYEIHMGTYPFPTDPMPLVPASHFQKNKVEFDNVPTFKGGKDVDGSVKSFIKRCIVLSPKDRASARQLLEEKLMKNVVEVVICPGT